MNQETPTQTTNCTDLESRTQAIADGRLIDITREAGRVGFRVPVAITRAAWQDSVEWIRAAVSRDGEESRLTDLLRELNERAVRTAELDPEGVALMRFYRIPTNGDQTKAEAVTIRLCIAMGTPTMPIITISLATEN